MSEEREKFEEEKITVFLLLCEYRKLSTKRRKIDDEDEDEVVEEDEDEQQRLPRSEEGHRCQQGKTFTSAS